VDPFRAGLIDRSDRSIIFSSHLRRSADFSAALISWILNTPARADNASSRNSTAKFRSPGPGKEAARGPRLTGNERISGPPLSIHVSGTFRPIVSVTAIEPIAQLAQLVDGYWI